MVWFILMTGKPNTISGNMHLQILDFTTDKKMSPECFYQILEMKVRGTCLNLNSNSNKTIDVAVCALYFRAILSSFHTHQELLLPTYTMVVEKYVVSGISETLQRYIPSFKLTLLVCLQRMLLQPLWKTMEVCCTARASDKRSYIFQSF